MTEEIENAIRRWMAGHPLTERETALVDAALRLNAINQFHHLFNGEPA